MPNNARVTHEERMFFEDEARIRHIHRLELVTPRVNHGIDLMLGRLKVYLQKDATPLKLIKELHNKTLGSTLHYHNRGNDTNEFEMAQWIDDLLYNVEGDEEGLLEKFNFALERRFPLAGTRFKRYQWKSEFTKYLGVRTIRFGWKKR